VRDVKDSGIAGKSKVLAVAVAAFILKNVLQFFSAFPAIALMAYQNRNFVIAYLHLVLLGFVTLYVFSQLIQKNLAGRIGTRLFLFSFITTEILLVLNASSGIIRLIIPYYVQLLLVCSLFFPVGIGLLLFGLKNKKAAPIDRTKQKMSIASAVM
jgi:hypothetical protein